MASPGGLAARPKPFCAPLRVPWVPAKPGGHWPELQLLAGPGAVPGEDSGFHQGTMGGGGEGARNPAQMQADPRQELWWEPEGRTLFRGVSLSGCTSVHVSYLLCCTSAPHHQEHSSRRTTRFTGTTARTATFSTAGRPCLRPGPLLAGGGFPGSSWVSWRRVWPSRK